MPVDLRPANPKLLILLKGDLSWRRVRELWSSRVRHLLLQSMSNTLIRSLIAMLARICDVQSDVQGCSAVCVQAK